MFALQTQSATPALGPPLVGLVVFVVLGAVVGAVGSAVVRRLSNPVGKYRLLYAVVLLPVTLAAYGLLALLGLGPAVVAAFGLDAGLFVGFLSDLVGLLAAGLVWLAAYAPTVRGVRAVRGIDLSTGHSLVRMARYVVGLSAVVAVVLAPLRAGSADSPLALAAVLVVLVLATQVASPWIVSLLRTTEKPTGRTAERIDDLRERAGLAVRDVRVLDTDDEETATLYVCGPPGYRRLFVTNTFLDRFDDETAVALLAVQAGRVRSRVLAVRVGTVVVAAFPLVAAVSGAAPRWPALAVALGTVGVGIWLSRRAVRAADEYAADRVGSEAVADALARYAEVHAMEPSRRRIPNPLSVNVALGDRIDRLRRRASG